MHRTPASPSRRHTTALQLHARGWLAGLLSLALGTGACGVGVEPVGDDLGHLRQGQLSTNGLSTNGLSTNGLSTNGLSTNGLSTNGLSTNGLSTNGFVTWFNQDPATADSVMAYVVTCAVQAGVARQFTNPVTGITHMWLGALGLAPRWASGLPATEVEQQVVSACLAAHANKYGLHVPISVLGLTTSETNAPIPYTAEELATYNQQEACFFGNLFDGTGVFAANDQPYLSADKSTPRTCGLASGPTQACPPITHVGMCATLCQPAVVGTTPQPYYESCAYNGKSYRPITARIRSQEIYRCGDGICQFTERCGTDTTALSCRADCGTCP
ncbi:hypothetical protein HUA74_10505 [Myxococcus sp. CA051A]|uniref:hypothetical protein n=1 Tax=unclassified Myxococcus TaxID=2648731 RepID=UPI00157A8AD0|nr:MULTISPECIES: hypothetical protein [unclassified Myxococcus]NTX09486.1 hypothetical protein [Myxococcus sp. CA056]NTX58105.1 hypothetical protein [Myxococcus sp. CA039A]NTX61093.1 hypothetical protein [Myxococcus sp. CA051A]